jgi:RNA polymerase sigma factor (sigma-70 family)
MNTTRASLLIRIKDLDNTRAWSEFDAIYRPVLRRYAQARGLTASEADDIAQECLLTIARKIERFHYDPGRGRFRGWLQTVAENRIRNFVRDRGPQSAPTGAFRKIPDQAPSPRDAFGQIWIEEHLHFCLEQLRQSVEAKVFEAFGRYAIEEEPAESVCADLGMTAAQLYKLKWRLTQQLARRMEELLGAGE